MAGERKITVTFNGKDVGLGSAASRAADNLDDVERSSRRASEGFDALGEGSDQAEQRFVGVADTVTGTQDVMAGFAAFSKGDMVGGLLTTTMGFADLASGVSNLIAPFASQVAAWVTGRGAMATADATGAAVHNTSWISMAASSLAGAAQVALAWLISVGPILIVIAIIVGLVVLIIKNWDTIKQVIQAGWEFVRSVSIRVWNAVRDFVVSVISGVVSDIRGKIDLAVAIFKGLDRRIKSALSTIADAITAPFRQGFDAIRGIWNKSLGGKGFSVPSWVPGVGGKEFRIPKLAAGGLVHGPMVAWVGDNIGAASDPEVVSPLSKLRDMIGPQRLIIDSAGSDLDEVLVRVLRKAIRNRGEL